MKKNGKSNHIRRNIVLGALLAIVCIGAAELAACRYFEPELYERIVAPARYAAAVTVDAGRTPPGSSAGIQPAPFPAWPPGPGSRPPPSGRS